MNAVRAITNDFEASGFTLLRQKNHLVWGCPCGHTQLISSATPCKGRADNNARALIRRTLRVCNQNLQLRECA